MGRNKSYLDIIKWALLNIDQALFGPPFYRDMVQESTELFTMFHLMGVGLGDPTGDMGGKGRKFSPQFQVFYMHVSALCVLWEHLCCVLILRTLIRLSSKVLHPRSPPLRQHPAKTSRRRPVTSAPRLRSRWGWSGNRSWCVPAEKAVEGSTEEDNHDNRGPAPPPHPLLCCRKPLEQGGVADCREDCRAGRRHEAKLELGWWEYLGSVGVFLHQHSEHKASTTGERGVRLRPTQEYGIKEAERESEACTDSDIASQQVKIISTSQQFLLLWWWNDFSAEADSGPGTESKRLG